MMDDFRGYASEHKFPQHGDASLAKHLRTISSFFDLRHDGQCHIRRYIRADFAVDRCNTFSDPLTFQYLLSRGKNLSLDLLFGLLKPFFAFRPQVLIDLPFAIGILPSSVL